MSGNEGPQGTTGLPVAEKGRRECCHYWVIGFPYDASSGARCRLCGEERQFSNYLMLSDSASTGKGGRRYLADYASDVRRQSNPYPMPPNRHNRPSALALLGEMGLGSRR
jgi:hypothetical protein